MRGYGKIILFGEHAAVYGYPALAAGISRGVSCEYEEGGGPIRLLVEQWNARIEPGEEPPLAQALRKILEAIPGAPSRGTMRLDLDIPAGAGLGSSAAMTVAMIRTLLAHRNLSWASEKVNELAFEAERAFHGTPSGIDNTVATFGGLCYLSDEARFPCPFAAKRLLLSRGTASLLGALPAPACLVVVHTLKERQTKAMVEKVRRLRSESPDLFDSTMEGIGSLAQAGYRALLEGDAVRFGAAMNENHARLQSLGVSSPELDRAADLALRAGAVGAKLTGAGGGGCLIAFGPGREAEIASSAQSAGFPAFSIEIGAGSALGG